MGSRLHHPRATALLAATLTGLAAGDARAELRLDFGGQLQTNLRFLVNDLAIGEFPGRLERPTGIDRSEQILKLKLNASAEDRYSGVVDADVVWLLPTPDTLSFGDLSYREEVDPVHLRVHSAYLQAADLFIEGIDFRIGQQIVAWGVGDQFNPTNNLNSADLQDRLLFGNLQANLMAKLDYTVPDLITLSGVLVPIFRPALVPTSASLGPAALDRLPHLDAGLRHRIAAETAASRSLGYPTLVRNAIIETPRTTAENMQFSFRAATTIGEHDLALSWYHGFSDFPQPLANFTEQKVGRICDPADPASCFDGLLQTDVTLGYPRIDVAGLNMAGELNLFGWISEDLKPLGYRLEVGVYFPREQRIHMTQGEVKLLGVTRAAGEYDYKLPDGKAPLVSDSQVFAKWTVGLDYTFGSHVYVNAQWVHGLVDEFGAGDFLNEGYSVRQSGVTSPNDDTLTCAIVEQNGDKCAREILRRRLGDYLVLGMDVKLLSDALLARLFTIIDLTGALEERWSPAAGKRVQTTFSPFSEEGFSAVIFPEINYNFGNGLELGGGVLFELGKPYTKFGDPAAGGHLVWTRARFSF